MFGLKAALCGFSAVAQDKHLFGRTNERLTNPLWSAMNTSLAARFSAAAMNNLGVVRNLRRQQQAASVPSYLMPTPGP
jgi:hypothetical protein